MWFIHDLKRRTKHFHATSTVKEECIAQINFKEAVDFRIRRSGFLCPNLWHFDPEGTLLRLRRYTPSAQNIHSFGQEGTLFRATPTQHIPRHECMTLNMLSTSQMSLHKVKNVKKTACYDKIN